ncbi:hypothetical protein RCL1_008412 [Eukaryota sp. TZLM3-RCL]
MVPITLVVRSRTYHTTLDTLTKHPRSKIAKIAKLLNEEQISKPLHVDRDPDLFYSIIMFLRTDQLIMKPHVDLIDVLEEARFFNLKPLVHRITHKLSKVDDLHVPDHCIYNNKQIKLFPFQKHPFRSKKRVKRRQGTPRMHI